jgi:uncharacterized protein (UPF0261 family)
MGGDMSVYVVGTCDTKYKELLFVKEIIEQSGIEVKMVDVSTKSHHNKVDISNQEIEKYSPQKENIINIADRGKAIALMSDALENFITKQQDLSGIIGLGGSGGTSLISKSMRALPIGIPKILVSTVASGNISHYIGASDIFMLYSVTDIAGINRISSIVLSNAANAIIGMITKKSEIKMDNQKIAIGLTMFGVTTPCVDFVRKRLENTYDCLVFHATGSGGQSMEKLVDSGMIGGVIDITTTEICDLFMGGVMSATEDRLGAIIRTKVPYVGSVGAMDMVNFGPIDTVPEKYKNRNLYIHNPQVTLMRTTTSENAEMGRWIANKLNKCEGQIRFLLPLKGVSMLDMEGKPFFDPEADEALFQSIEKNLIQTNMRKLIKLDLHINDREFANALVENFLEIINQGG